MRTILKKHNKAAYDRVMAAFERDRMTCVCHPTGTGKSYIIAAVAEHFKRVLILAPNIFVLDQIRDVLRWRKEGIEYMTYTLLNFTECPKTDYDLICLDEFHRAGAPEWGDAVLNLLKINPQAKVLGTTATPVRDGDNNRNMAEELFGNNISSVMSIAEAWNRNILPVPTYVTGLFDFSATATDAEEKISTSKYLTKAEKKRRITRLNNMRLDWEHSEGMPYILRKYLDRDCRRVIVFCASVDFLEQMQQTVCSWFRKAGFQLGTVSLLHTYLTDKQQEQAMAQFQSDDGDGVKLMFSVNMLNEGVHVPRVNAVLMLRTTSSRIIYMQQLGRCLTAANTEKPVVFDMVDNMTQTNTIHVIRDEFNQLEQQHTECEDGPREFTVHDHCRTYREMIVGLTDGATNNWNTDEQVVVRILKFIEQHGRLPLSNTSHEERKLYLLMMSRREAMEANETINNMFKLLRKQGDAGVEQNIQLIKEFIAEKGRLPRKGEDPYFGKWTSLKNNQKQHPDVIAIRQDYGARHMTDFEATEWAERIIEFMKQNNRLPNSFHEEEKTMENKYGVLKRNYPTRPMVPEMLAMASQYRISSDHEIAEQVIRFERENGRMPSCESERSLYMKFNRRRDRLAEAYPDIKALCNKYYFDDETPAKRFARLKAYCEEHGHLPSKREDPEVYQIIPYLRYGHPSPEFDQLMNDYLPLGRIDEAEINRRLDIIEAFCQEQGRLPSASDTRPDESRLSLWWERMKKKRGSHPRVKEIKAKYPQLRKKNSIEYAEKMERKRHERIARQEQRKLLPSFTKKQNKLRNTGKTKYGYIVPLDAMTDPARRFCIYYSQDTRRMPRFEKSCHAAGLTVTNIL